LLSSRLVIGWECVGGNESLDAALESCGGCDYSAGKCAGMEYMG
jgi:hypothetical protein